MIDPNNAFLLGAVLLLAAFVGMYGERRGWFKHISGVLVTIIIMAVLATVGLVPSASDSEVSVPLYSAIFKYLVPVAIPLLLFKVQLVPLIRDSGRLLGIFLIGSVAVVAGALAAHLVMDMGDEAAKIAGVFIGTYTGGSVNFMAVAATLDFLQSPLFGSVIAVDNVFTNFYIMALFAIPSVGWLVRRFKPWKEEEKTTSADQSTAREWGLESITLCLLIAVGVAAFGVTVGPLIQQWLSVDIDLSILIVTVVILVLANVFPAFLASLTDIAFSLGMFFLYIFLGVIGTASHLGIMLTAAPSILIFAAIVLVVHFMIIMLAGRLLGYSLQEILLASCANAAGPSVAAPMAASFGMKSAVTPAVLVAIMGYVIGTFLGVGTGLFLS